MRSYQIAPLLFLAACQSSSSTPAEPPASKDQPALAPQTAAPHASPKAESPGAAPAERAGELAWKAPAPFVARAPKSSMRAAEYGLEGEARAELSVFYFGPDQGGSVDANLQRWLGQFKQPDGSDSAAKAKREELNVQGMAVTTIEVTGTYSGGMGTPGMGAPTAGPDFMLLGAIASGPKGPVFFKLVGPEAALEKARPQFRGLLESLHVEPAAAH
jgi:hypothetical protein